MSYLDDVLWQRTCNCNFDCFGEDTQYVTAQTHKKHLNPELGLCSTMLYDFTSLVGGSKGKRSVAFLQGSPIAMMELAHAVLHPQADVPAWQRLIDAKDIDGLQRKLLESADAGSCL